MSLTANSDSKRRFQRVRVILNAAITSTFLFFTFTFNPTNANAQFTVVSFATFAVVLVGSNYFLYQYFKTNMKEEIKSTNSYAEINFAIRGIFFIAMACLIFVVIAFLFYFSMLSFSVTLIFSAIAISALAFGSLLLKAQNRVKKGLQPL